MASRLSLLAASLAATFLAPSASAHVSYTGRDFGAFAGDGSDAPQIRTASNVSSAFGWADATDADYGDSHRTRAFRFKLNAPAVVTLNVKGTTVSASAPLPFPAFSVYSGLCHVSPDAADHDASPISASYLLTTGGTQPKEGALVALGDWKIGNEDVYNTPGDPMSGVAIPASLSSLKYIGHAADGTSANYGSTPGIQGDGVADNDVTGTFTLPAGDYTVMIGGGNYAAGIGAVAPFTNYGITATLSVTKAPEALVKGGASSAAAGAVYSTLYPPAINGDGIVAFRANIKAGTATKAIIGRRTLDVEAVATAGDAAPDSTSTWKSFGDPVVNEAGEVAFSAMLTRGIGDVLANGKNDAGVWTDLGGTVHLALREGAQAPGLPTGQLFTTIQWFNLQDGVLHIGAATSDGTSKSGGVWKWDGNSLSKVVALGDTLSLLDATTHIVKTLSKSSSSGNGNASSRLVGSDGTLALLVVFTDGRSEILEF